MIPDRWLERGQFQHSRHTIVDCTHCHQVEHSRDTAAAHVALAEAYLRLKDVPGARTHVQKALQLDPSSADAKALQERIEKGGHL